MNLKQYMETKRREIDALLQESLQSPNPAFDRIYESMRYSVLAGGKRIRPVLLLAAWEACSESPQNGYRAALAVGAAIEMIHTYSLIHDDLPAMDNDDLRRGRPTNHKVYGEALAILAGDSLLTEAFGVIANIADVPASTLLSLVTDIADSSGARGMAGGQVLDLAAEGRKISREDLEIVHRHKTGCLIRVSVTSGAKLAGANADKLTAIATYGRCIGLSFQIADDILDVEGGTEELGKTAGADALN
jgi:geranylgeranyl diphosphate synthase type II